MSSSPTTNHQPHCQDLGAVSHDICTRCRGLMVNEACFDLLHNTSELGCTTQRCLQCGDITDAVIMRNRQLSQAAAFAGLTESFVAA